MPAGTAGRPRARPIVVSLVLAAVLGLVTLRTREFVFSLVTYAAAVVAMEVAFNWSFLGGSDGIVGVPPLELTLFGQGVTARGNARPVAGRLGAADADPAVRPALPPFAARHQRADGADEPRPRAWRWASMPARVRFLVFVASAPISALAGWLYAYQRAYVGPDMFESYFLVLMLTAIVIVGRRLLLGPLIGTALIIVQQTFFSIGGDGDKIVLGAVLAAILLLWPKGLVGLWDVLAAKRLYSRSATAAR